MAKKSTSQSTIWIYEEHSDIANKLLGGDRKDNQKNIFGAIGTGVFRLLLDSYTFAASIGLALQESTPENEMPANNKRKHDIKESTVMGYDGGRDLAIIAGLLSHKEDKGTLLDGDNSEQVIRDQMNELSDSTPESQWENRFRALDRYAHRGFNWLLEKQQTHTTIEDLIVQAGLIEIKEFDHDF